ncbi:uncharacterized protein EAF02_009990 [Botrytis sinoallii]|uniref:uncharacterized protein n=1 Tax=Botrytis sinoallii TaxID=1463999 RepID=UPI0018FF4C1B|nr:uncharacterized protein EAF02_009990 [Botrytis sinoallii]KAF7865567.1 hypothetical protein EAF02_009990 [Botrytis sinoallii]
MGRSFASNFKVNFSSAVCGFWWRILYRYSVTSSLEWFAGIDLSEDASKTPYIFHRRNTKN